MANNERAVLSASGRYHLVACFSVFVLLVASVLASTNQVISGSFNDSSDVNNYTGQTPPVSSLSEQTSTQEPLALTYVANMGVQVSSGDYKVMIDCLFDQPNPYYRTPTHETLDSILKGRAPFDNVDLLLVTHNHSDHFDAALAVRYLEVRPEPVLMAPSDAVEMMRKAAEDWSRIEPRIIPIDLKAGEIVRREVAGIPLTIFRTLHLGDHEPMNLMYLTELNGWRVFHVGDWGGKPEDFLKFGFETVPVDLAVIGYIWPLSPNPSYPRFLQEVLKPGHIALAHLDIKEESVAASKIAKVRQYYEDIFVLLPGMPAKSFWK